jgi:hypothetical protein
MFFVGFGGLGLLLLIPALFIMFSRNGARWMPGLMWVLFALDCLFGAWLFAAIQGFFLWHMYHRRQIPPVQPPDSSGQLPGPYGPPSTGDAFPHMHGQYSHAHPSGEFPHDHNEIGDSQ